MPQKRRWTDEELVVAVRASTSYRSVLLGLGLKPAGGNYAYLAKNIARLRLGTSHFKGKAWNKGMLLGSRHKTELPVLLVKNSSVQSHKLKQRLIMEGIKTARCELCGWAKAASDGRIPIELDHINGDNRDNRLENLRILCPNCHSLQPTHRGKNKGKYARVV